MFGTMVLFCVSFAGYMLFIKNRFQIKSDLLPAFVCSVIVLGLYIASLAGVLAAAFWIIEWTGVFFLAETVIERILRKQPLFTWLRKLFTPGTVLFLAAMIYFSIFLSGYRWMNYDNYSHWGRLAAHLNEYNRLPSSADSLIVFQSYPPAAGLWIYYVTKAIGFSEGNALIAQAILVMSYGITLFALIPERRQWWYLPLGMVVLAFQLCISVRISDLLVDTLMALAGFASLAFLLTERNRPLKAAWLSAPVMGCLILIKNPAVLFILVDAGVLVYLLLRVRKTIRWKQAVAALAALLIPVCAYIGWNVHVRGEFPSGMNASHAMSLEHYQTVLSQKTQEEREQILQLYLEKTFSLETDATRRMVKMEIAAIAGLLALWLLNRRFPRKMLAGLLAGNLLMAVYWVMLAGMYLVSMETHAALA